MKSTHNSPEKRYLLAFYPTSGREKLELKIMLRKDCGQCGKKLRVTPAKKSLLTLQSH